MRNIKLTLLVGLCAITSPQLSFSESSFSDLYLKRETSQSPFNTADSLYNYNIALYASFAPRLLLSNPVVIISTDNAKMIALKTIKDHCLSGGQVHEKCRDVIASLPSEDATAVLKAAIDTDLHKLEEFLAKDWVTNITGKSLPDQVKKLREVDGEIKAVIYNHSVNMEKWFGAAEKTIGAAITVAELFNMSERDIKHLKEIGHVAATAKKIMDLGSAAGRAYAGDISAYFVLFNGVASLLTSSKEGQSIELVVNSKLNQVLVNQQIMLEKIDRVIEQMQTVSNQITSLHRDVLVIDANVRDIISSNRQNQQSQYIKCLQASSNIKVLSKVNNTFPHLSYPYNNEAYENILNTAILENRKSPFVKDCADIVGTIFPSISESVNPSAVFKVENVRAGAAPYLQDMVEFLRLYRKQHENTAAGQYTLLDLVNLAMVPATRISDIDKKLTIKPGSSDYLFGGRDEGNVRQAFLNPLNPHSVSIHSNELYDMLPYVWIQDGRRNAQGITDLEQSFLLNSLINSIHLNLLASAQESFLQGDVVIPYIFSVLEKKTIIKHGNIESEINRLAADMITQSKLLRDNYLLYVIFKSYGENGLSRYRLDYSLSATPSPIKSLLGAGGLDIRLAQNTVGDREVQIELPCKVQDKANSYQMCWFPLPTPDEYSKFQLNHSNGTIALANARRNGNQLLTVIQMYHPKWRLIKDSGL